MKPRTTTLMLCGALGLSSACGAFKTKDKGKKFSQSDMDIAKRWKSDCADASLLDLTQTIKDYRYSAVGDFDRREDFFPGNNCQEKYLSFQLLGTYQTLGKDPANSNVKDINYTVSKALLTARTETAVKKLNEEKFCGLSDWRVGEEREVTGKECAGITYKKGDVIYDVYEISDKTLYLGPNFSFSTEALQLTERPKDVVKEQALHAQ